jgi:hypothetical protein
MVDKTWDLMRYGKIEKALAIMREGYEHEPLQCEMDLGIGLLYAREYTAAFDHFMSLIGVDVENGRPTCAPHYGFAGAAKWCLGQCHDAVDVWRDGLGAGFADGAGGVKIPLLLFAAHALRPNRFPALGVRSRKALAAKAKSRRIEAWPGAVAQYVLGRINESELRQRSVDDEFGETRPHLWLAEFYVGLMALVSGNVAVWADAVMKTSNLPNSEAAEHSYFLSCVWNEEFFLARHEAAHLPHNE